MKWPTILYRSGQEREYRMLTSEEPTLVGAILQHTDFIVGIIRVTTRGARQEALAVNFSEVASISVSAEEIPE